MKEITKAAEAAKEAAELSKKIDAEKSRNKQFQGYLQSDIVNKRDTTKNANEVKRSSERLEKLERDRQKALNRAR